MIVITVMMVMMTMAMLLLIMVVMFWSVATTDKDKTGPKSYTVQLPQHSRQYHCSSARATITVTAASTSRCPKTSRFAALKLWGLGCPCILALV